jgi:hypothetical protein
LWMVSTAKALLLLWGRSFYLDLSHNSSIVRMMMAVSHSVHKVVYGLTR